MESVKIYYDYNNNLKCFDIFNFSPSVANMDGWNVLACEGLLLFYLFNNLLFFLKDMVMPMSSNGI